MDCGTSKDNLRGDFPEVRVVVSLSLCSYQNRGGGGGGPGPQGVGVGVWGEREDNKY